MTAHVTVIGEALIDVIRRPDSEQSAVVGGSSLNTAITMARLGLDVALISQVGTDAYGQMLRDYMSANRVQYIHSGSHTGTSVATATLNAQGSASYDFALTWDVANISLPIQTNALHFGSLASAVAPGRDAVAQAVRDALAGDLVVSYDPNIRPALVDDVESSQQRAWDLAHQAHVVRMSDEDLEFITPGCTPGEAADRLFAHGNTEVLLITCGGEPTFWATKNARGQVTGPKVEVVDTIGAGDSFIGGFLTYLSDSQLLSVKALQGITQDQVVNGVVFAQRVAAITCSRAGANPPTRAELG